MAGMIPRAGMLRSREARQCFAHPVIASPDSECSKERLDGRDLTASTRLSRYLSGERATEASTSTLPATTSDTLTGAGPKMGAVVGVGARLLRCLSRRQAPAAAVARLDAS